MVPDKAFIGELDEVVGTVNVLTDPELTHHYRRDWTGRFVAPSATVVRPGDVTEVAAIIELCRKHHVAVVPQGGNTGLVAGAVPISGELVVSTERLTGIESVSAGSGGLTALAGTPLATVQQAALDHGWAYGVDIASRDSATIGGTVATNAGGLRVSRYGDSRQQVVGIEMVAGTAEIISEMSGTLRNNTGYHLPSLVAGSEGTLGILTRVALRLVPRFHSRTAALLRFENPSDATNSAERLRGLIPGAESIELFFGDGLQLVCSTFSMAPPFPTTDGGYVLVEVAGQDDQTAGLAEAVEALAGVSDVAVADDSTGRARLWRYRELHTEAIAALGVAHKLDVAVPPGTLDHFMTVVPETIRKVAPQATTWLFGHAGESAVHVNVTGLGNDDYSADEAVLNLVIAMGGSISAEHGIGRTKLSWMGLAHSEADLALLRRIKSAFDPDGIMNPAVLI